MPTGGWISVHAYQDDSLEANANGRAAMQDGYIVNAKINDATITAAKLASGVGFAGYYGLSTYGNAFYG